jgi:hypothetical protein
MDQDFQCQTYIETPLTQPFFADERFRDDVLRRIPLGRVGTIAEVLRPLGIYLLPTHIHFSPNYALPQMGSKHLLAPADLLKVEMNAGPTTWAHMRCSASPSAGSCCSAGSSSSPARFSSRRSGACYGPDEYCALK